ncbi:contact-dependent growth inhibition system immunity protein [[Mycobacterium] burgundiense]|uniref:Contact-dependent growth inhibition system immunity protein n=1 Tax=[Mycobacterium] burgundiense TaxID=3064286 RepID=A0ABN9NID7_9MYCO|nr:contact-dependent growth inhibition system immunity protein [Mycolicibacterium sp. MU0053]CAJ1506873.1 contact-dependent growth inhibition system immunity protein [Mycolicibacterium sp. MU0053]
MNDGSVPHAIQQFFAAYFHQDWDLEADDWQGVVDIYVNDDPTAAPLRTLAQEIDNLRETRTEPELEQLLAHTIGAYHNPRPLPFTEWLGQVAHRLRLHATAIENGTAL